MKWAGTGKGAEEELGPILAWGCGIGILVFFCIFIPVGFSNGSLLESFTNFIRWLGPLCCAMLICVALVEMGRGKESRMLWGIVILTCFWAAFYWLRFFP